MKFQTSNLIRSFKRWRQQRQTNKIAEKATIICDPQPDPFTEKLLAKIACLKNQVLSRARQNRKLQRALDDFLTIFQVDESSRIIRHHVKNWSILIVINDHRPEQLTITAYIPALARANVGHIFATGRDEHYTLNDIYIDPVYRENRLGTKLLDEAIMSIISHGGKTVKGEYKIEQANADKLVYFFGKFGFTAVLNEDSNMTISKEFRTKLK